VGSTRLAAALHHEGAAARDGSDLCGERTLLPPRANGQQDRGQKGRGRADREATMSSKHVGRHESAGLRPGMETQHY